MRKWTKESIIVDIKSLAAAGHDLNYSTIAEEQVALLRAATRYFGSWRVAIEAAGLHYVKIRRYQAWSREKILDRIKALHKQGVDLSWRNISTQVDPQLAAAATKFKHFGSWRGAIEAAGLDYSKIRKYKEWSEAAIIERIKELHKKGTELNAKSVEEHDITLITAARRRYESWDRALEAAGLDHTKIVLRTPYRRQSDAGTK
ncbi:MAG: hypothetical protein KGJ62_13480 [Armatimonadetes bacterium]|nr:hypothetical protein [Armatimonadota bacterium]MDE2207459.1 hypothetical protein [Armatimonadota bacterium]